MAADAGSAGGTAGPYVRQLPQAPSPRGPKTRSVSCRAADGIRRSVLPRHWGCTLQTLIPEIVLVPVFVIIIAVVALRMFLQAQRTLTKHSWCVLIFTEQP